jgi:hypothetical protein
VQALLSHLRRSGFTAAPEPLGFDHQGRAVLKFIDGEVHAGWPDPMPRWIYEDALTLTAAAQLLRRYHDIAISFVAPPNAHWRTVAPVTHEVICHFDWAPYNALFRGHEPIVMLDWDSAGPGSRVWDVALSASQWVPLHPMADGVSNKPVLPLAQQAARLATYCDAYGGVTATEAIDALIEELPFHADLIQRLADAGDPAASKLVGWNVPTRVRSEVESLRRHRAQLI